MGNRLLHYGTHLCYNTQVNIIKSRNNGIWAVILTAVLTASCDFFNWDQETQGTSFYAQNMVTSKFYTVKANKLVEGAKCVIWAEAGSGVTTTDAREIANEYDNNIRPKIVNAFSEKNFTYDYKGTQYHFNDILDYANWFTGGDDGKLTILLLDIKDGYNPQTGSYVAGYFFSGDFLPQGKIGGPDSDIFSNGMDMIYIDTSPGLKRKEQAYATFAHELQHLISAATMIYIDREFFQDTWIDEGLSSQAEYLYLGRNPADKCQWFSNDQKGTIAKGNNFFVWGNHAEEPLAILDDYATVYLFFRWLYLQANEIQKQRLFRDIITSEEFDYRAVTNAASKINPAWANWETLLRTWFAANYAPSNAAYGYKGDDYLQRTIKVTPIAGNSIMLYPGEGVYSIINGSFSSANQSAPGFIRYAGLASNGTITGTSSPYSGNRLLTFNTNTTSKTTLATPASGQLTGITPPVSVSIGTNGTAGARTVEATGPYVIDARDLLGRNREAPTISPRSLRPLR